MSRLENKVAIVTGASKGIGAEIARAMAKEGATVVVNYVSDRKSGEAVVEEITNSGGSAVAIQANVSQARDVKRLFEEVGTKFGKIDILVNNAGVYKFEPIEAATEEEFYRQFNSNVLGTILSIQEALKYLHPEGASIINISSVASVKATPMALLYSASKGAVDAITRSLSKELGARKVRVNSILPGPTETEGNKVIGTEMEDFIVGQTALGRIGKPGDISKLAVFLASDEAAWITGQKICVSGGFD